MLFKKQFYYAKFSFLSFFIATTSLASTTVTDPNDCVLRKESGRELYLENICNVKISIQYCVENDSSPFACSKPPFGGKILDAGKKEAIPEYGSRNGGRVWTATCFYPGTPTNFRPNTGRSNFQCK